MRRVKAQANGNGNELDARIREIAARLEAIPGEIKAAKRVTIDDDHLRAALEAFGPVWDALWPKERARVITLLLEGVVYGGRERRIEIRLSAGGIGTA